MKFGVVELPVDPRGIRASGATDAVWQGIRRDEQRDAVVRRALHHAVGHGCDLVVFPGWTLVEPALPPWLLDASAGCTVVVECILPDTKPRSGSPRKGRPASKGKVRSAGVAPVPETIPSWCRWRGYVVADGQVVVGRAPQFVAEICRNRQAVEDAGLTAEDLARLRLVVNPAHTASSLAALRDKRARLSRGGLVLHTANTQSGGWQRKVESEVVPGRRSFTAARAWVGGKAQEWDEEVAGTGFVLKMLAWRASRSIVRADR
jgi:hypothetical protein